MGEDGIADRRGGQASQHCHLHAGHDFARLGADHREAHDAILACGDEGLHEALPLACGVRAHDCVHGQLRDAHRDPLLPRLAFARFERRGPRASR